MSAYLVFVGVSSSARADGALKTFVSIGGELSSSPEIGGHGWALVRLDREGLLPRGARLSFEYNTDTLRLSIDRVRVDRLELAVGVVGEAVMAGVLTDYWRDGHDQTSRAFMANFFGAVGGAKVDLGPHFIELTAGFRQWIFARWISTAKALTLPPDAAVGELRFRYTFWKVKPDPSLWEPSRPFARVRGIAAGAEASIDFRSDARPWGARDPSFGVIDLRNDPARMVVGIHQWLRAGVQLHDRVRLQAREQLDFLWGADDLDRIRVGGMNPYVVPLAGAPWPAYLTDRQVSAEGSIHVRVHGQHEVGALVDVVGMPDVRRVGAEGTWHALVGVGLFADLRVKTYQIDGKVGWSPTVTPGRDRGSVSALASFGWGTTKAK